MKNIGRFLLPPLLSFFLGTGLNAQVMIYLDNLNDCEPAQIDLYNNSDIGITGTPLWE